MLPPLAAAAAPIAGDPMTDAIDAAKLLDVDVDQFARPLALVTHHRHPRIERGQLPQSAAAQHRSHARHRHVQLAGNRRAAHSLPPQALNLLDPFGVKTVLAAVRRRAAVGQRRLTPGPITGQPAIASPHRDPGRLGRIRYLPTLNLDPLHQQESTRRGQARILVDVHPGDPPITHVSFVTHSLTGLPRVNNLHSNDS